jgi:hypothetical protein
LSAKDPRFGVLPAGFNCDVFVFARHEGIDIQRGWHFYVLPDKTVQTAAERNTVFDQKRLEQLHAVRCEPTELKMRIAEAVRSGGRARSEQTEAALPVAGVDGYRGGWIAVDLDAGGGATARTGRQLADLLDTEAAVVAVDIPIGIPEGAARAADAEARRFVGARGSSVFTTPPRAALLAETFAEANLVARELTGKGLSQQSFALRHRILEVDALAEADERIVEVHPEVSFCELG